MKIKTWHHGLSDRETAELAYWERNMLALRYADGWYNDDVLIECKRCHSFEVGAGICVCHPDGRQPLVPRYPGWRRVLTLDAGHMTFHIPDDFDIGDLPRHEPNWDGHTTEEKWQRVQQLKGCKA